MNAPCVDWATARHAARGFSDSGDECSVRSFGRRLVMAVLDGLGHGPAAAGVAREGVRLLEQAPTPDVLAILKQCHQGLRGTRGLVMSLAMFDEEHNTMAWAGVGNVSGALWSPRLSRQQSLLLRGGLLGSALPPLRPSTLSVEPGDMLVLATDGVASEIGDRLLRGPTVQAIADRILSECGHRSDDALVLVGRYRGASS